LDGGSKTNKKLVLLILYCAVRLGNIFKNSLSEVYVFLVRTNTTSLDEIQSRIEPVHGDLDEEIDGLHSRVGLLKGVELLIAVR
jgi:protein transporter SFT1